MASKNFFEQLDSFTTPFWLANAIEFLERFSFYCTRLVVGIYIVTTTSHGGLALSQTEKGQIFAVWALIQCLVPIFTGGISDRYGYKNTLAFAFSLNAIGFALMAYADGYASFLCACCLLALGTGIFKPPIQAVLSHSLTKENSSVGWGVFYISVNIGGCLAPFLASFLRSQNWKYVFLASSVTILLAYPCLFWLKEPERSGNQQKSPKQILLDMASLVRDYNLMLFFGIYSIFTLLFMQLWDTLPIFIDQWVQSNSIVAWLGQTTGIEFLQSAAAKGLHIPAELMLNINTFIIILFTIPIAWFFGRFRHLKSMAWGMLLCTIAFLFCGVSRQGFFYLFAIAVFSIGEIACSPKFSEYISILAPPDKKALYLGFTNLPFAFGWATGSILTGWLSDRFSDVYRLSARYLVEVLQVPANNVASIPRGDLLQALAAKLEISISSTKALLWETYHPPIALYILGGIGLFSVFAMLWYDAKMKHQKPENQT